MNSNLVTVTAISPHRTSPRNHAIDTITIHCAVAQCTAKRLGEVFATKRASSNYGIGFDGSIGLYVEECDASWCSSNTENDHRAITIEVASDNTHPYAVTDAAYTALIDLLVDICQRNHIKNLLWEGNPSLIGQVTHQNMTVHRWFANKSCPGDWLYARHGEIAMAVNDRLRPTVTTAIPVADWAKSAWDKATLQKILDGTRPAEPITRQEVAVILDRLGLLN